MSDPNIQTFNIKVLADTKEAADSLVKLVGSIQESIAAFTRFPEEAANASTAIATSFERSSKAILSSMTPLTEFVDMLKGMKGVSEDAAKAMTEPFKGLHIDQGLGVQVAEISRVITDLKTASKDVRLAPVATGLERIVSVLGQFSKADADLAKLDSATTALSTSFGRLLDLITRLKGGQEGLVTLQKITLQPVNYGEFMKSLNEVQTKAFEKINEIAKKLITLEAVPIKFKIGEITFPSGDLASLKAHFAPLEEALQKYFGDKQIQLPPLGWTTFANSLKEGVGQVEKQFSKFKKDIFKILEDTKLDPGPFVKYAESVKKAVQDAQTSTQGLKSILNELKTLTEINLTLKFPSKTVLGNQIKNLQEGIQTQIKGLEELFSNTTLKINFKNVQLDPSISNRIQTAFNKLKGAVPELSIGSQVTGFEELSSSTSGLGAKLNLIGEGEKFLAEWMPKKNIALAEQVGLFRQLGEVKGLDKIFATLSKISSEKITPVNVSGVVESLTQLVRSFDNMLNVSTAIRESQNIIVESSKKAVEALKLERAALEGIAKVAGDVAKAAEFKQVSSPQIVTDAQINKEISNIRILSGSIDGAREKLAQLAQGDKTSAFNKQLKDISTQALTLKNYLANMGDALKSVISAEAGAGINPKTAAAWNIANQNVREYISLVIRSNTSSEEGAVALKNQQVLLSANKGMIDNIVTSLSKQDSTYSEISKRVSDLLTGHKQLLDAETKEFKNEAEITTAMRAREVLIKNLANLMKTVEFKQQGAIFGSDEALKLAEVKVQLTQIGDAIKAPMSALKSFSADNAAASESVLSFGQRLRSLSLDIKAYENIQVPESKLGFRKIIEQMARLREEVKSTSLSLDSLAKSSVLSGEVKMDIGVQQTSLTGLIAELGVYEQRIIDTAKKTNLQAEADASLAKANVTVSETFAKLTESLAKQQEVMAKISSSTISTGAGSIISSEMAAARDSVNKALADIESSMMKAKDSIETVLKGAGINIPFEGIEKFKQALNTLAVDPKSPLIDPSSIQVIQEALKFMNDLNLAKKELTSQNTSSVFIIPPGTQGQMTRLSSEIRNLDTQFNQLGSVINQVMAGAVPADLFNKMSNAAKNSSVTIISEMVNIETVLKQLRLEFDSTAGKSAGLFSSMDSSPATNSLKSLLSTLKLFENSLQGLSGPAFLAPLIKALAEYTDASTPAIERTRAFNEIINLLGASGSGVSQVYAALKEQFTTLEVSNNIKALPQQFADVAKQIKDVIAETDRLKAVSAAPTKSGTNTDYQIELMQLKELVKENTEAAKAAETLEKALASIAKVPLGAGKDIFFKELQNAANGLKASLEQKFGITIDMASADTAFKSVYEQYIKLKDSVQSNKINLNINTAQITEAMKSTSMFGDAIFQATGMHNTMRALTEEGALLSKGIKNYFTSLADGLKIGKESVVDLQNGLTSLEDELVRLRSGVVTWSMGIMMMGQAMVAPFVKATKDFMDFGDTMQMVKGVSESTEATMRKLTDTTLLFTSASRFDPKAASEGLLELARAGFSADEALSALPTVLRLAQAGALAVGESAVISSHLMHTFQLQSEEALSGVADILVKAANESTANVSDIGHAFTYVGALAKGFGVTMEETVGTIGALANVGFTGTMAGTALRGMLEHLFNPTKEEAKMMDELSQRIGGVGLQIKDSEGNFIGFANVIGQLEKAGLTSSEALKLFGQRAGPGVAAMMKLGSSALEDFNNKMYTAGGTAGALSDTMEQSLKGRFELMSRSIESLMLAIASSLEAPLKGAFDVISNVVTAIHNFHDALGPVGTVVDVIAASMAGLMATIGSATFAWFLMVVPVTQFIGFLRLMVATMEVGKTTLLETAAAEHIATAAKLESIAAMTGVNVATNSNTTVQELNTVAKAQALAAQNGLTAAQMVSEYTTAAMTDEQIIQTMAIDANTLAQIRNSGSLTTHAVAVQAATLAQRGFFATLGAFTKMIVADSLMALKNFGYAILALIPGFDAAGLAAKGFWVGVMGPIGLAVLAIGAIGGALYGVYYALTGVERAKEEGLKFEKQSESVKKYTNDVKDAEIALKKFTLAQQTGTASPDESKDAITKALANLRKLEDEAKKHGSKDIKLIYNWNPEFNTNDVLVKFKNELIPVIKDGQLLTSKLGEGMGTGLSIGWEKALDSFNLDSLDAKQRALKGQLEAFGKELSNTSFWDFMNTPIGSDPTSEAIQKEEMFIQKSVSLFKGYVNDLKETGSDISKMPIDSIMSGFWNMVGTVPAGFKEKASGELTSALDGMVRVYEQFGNKLSEIQPFSSAIDNLMKSTDGLKPILDDLGKGVEEISKKVEEKFKNTFAAIEKYLEAYTKMNAESTKDQIKDAETASAARLAIAKRTADQTGTYEAQVADEMRRVAAIKDNILIESLKKEEDIRKKMLETVQTQGSNVPGFAEAQKVATEKLIEVFGKEKAVYQQTVDAMIAESAKLSDVISGLISKNETFQARMEAIRTKMSGDPGDINKIEKVADAELAVKKKLADAEIAFKEGNYAKEIQLAEQAAKILESIDQDVANSWSASEKERLKALTQRVGAVSQQGTDAAVKKTTEAQKDLNKMTEKYQDIIQKMSVSMDKAGDKMVTSVESMQQAFNNLILLTEKLAGKQGVEGIRDGLKFDKNWYKDLDDTVVVDKIQGIIDKADEFKEVFSDVAPLQKDSSSFEYLAKLDDEFKKLAIDRAAAFSNFRETGNGIEVDVKKASASITIFKEDLKRTGEELARLQSLLQAKLNSGVTPEVADAINTQMAKIKEFQAIVTEGSKQVELIDVSKLEDEKSQVFGILQDLESSFTKVVGSSSLTTDMNLQVDLLTENIGKIKEAFDKVGSAGDIDNLIEQIRTLQKESGSVLKISPSANVNLEKLLSQLEKMKSELAIVKTTSGSVSLDGFKKATGDITKSIDATTKYTKAVEAKAAAEKASIMATDESAASQDRYAATTERSVSAVEELTAAQQQNRKVQEDLDRVVQGVSSKGNTALSWGSGIEKATENANAFMDVWSNVSKSVEDFSKQTWKINLDTSDIKTEAETKAKIDELSAGLDKLKSAKEGVAGSKMNPEDLQAFMQRLGELEKAYQGTIDKLQQTLPTPAVAVTAESISKAVTDVQAKLQSPIPPIDVNVLDNASGPVQQIKSAVDQLHDKTITITTRYVEAHKAGGVVGEFVRHFAEGGDVFSRPNYSVVPGTGSGDKVPAMLEPGEFILRKNAVEKFGKDFLYRLNAGVLQLRQSGGFISSLRSSLNNGLNVDPKAMINYSYNSSPVESNSSKVLDTVNVNLHVGNHPKPFVVQTNRDIAHELLSVLKNIN